MRHLRRGPDGQRIAGRVRRRQHAAPFHRMRGASMRPEALGEHPGRPGERGLAIPVFQRIALQQVRFQLAARAAILLERGSAIGHGRQRLILHPGDRRRVLGLAPAVGQHHRHGLAGERDFRPGQHERRRVGRQVGQRESQRHAPFRQLAIEIRRCVGGRHARHGSRGGQVDRHDAGVRAGCARSRRAMASPPECRPGSAPRPAAGPHPRSGACLPHPAGRAGFDRTVAAHAPPRASAAPPAAPRPRCSGSRCNGTTGQHVTDPRLVRIRFMGQQLRHRHQDPRRAEAALQAVQFMEGLLDRMQGTVGPRQSFHRADLAPPACTASIRQPRAEQPSTSTVQAPHTPCSQPTWVPVMPSSPRRKSARFISARRVPAGMRH